MANTVKSDKGIEVYENDIQLLADDYLNNLDDPNMIYKTQVFKGMLKHIYINIFKISKNDIKYNNKNSNLDYSDIDKLDSIWDIYTSLCYKYNQSPTLLNFSVLTGIDSSTFTEWKMETSRTLSTSHSKTVKKWAKECESAAYDIAMSGNPGGMFILKANYGYVETAPIQMANAEQQRSIEQIAAERGLETSKNDIKALPIAEF